MCGGAVGGVWGWGSCLCQPHAPTSSPGWVVKGWPWGAAGGAQGCAPHSSWAAFGPRNPWEVEAFPCSQSRRWCGATSSMERLETAMGRWRGRQRKLLWKCETFRCEFSSPSCPCSCPWLDSQGGMCPLLFRPVYVTLNNKTQPSACEMKTPEGQTSEPRSALPATQGICVCHSHQIKNNKNAEKT